MQRYRRALVLGSSDRVKRSIEDQLHFMAKTLDMRRQQLAEDDKASSPEYKKLAVQLKRLKQVLKFVTEQGKLSRSITKSMTQRRGLAQRQQQEQLEKAKNANTDKETKSNGNQSSTSGAKSPKIKEKKSGICVLM